MSTSPANRKYDVAISFLASDLAIAAEMHAQLTGALKVFFYPRNQEELAGTDGLESMRAPFFDQSRVIVVLYRPRWGQTNWTRVEETAIKEGCLHGGWGGLFFIDLDDAAAFPAWLPETHVRLNWREFGLQQALGAIKLRVQDRGGELRPPTAMSEVVRVKAATDHVLAKRNALRDERWIYTQVLPGVQEVFSQVEKLCADAEGLGIELHVGSGQRFCTVTNYQLSLRLDWTQRAINDISDASLTCTLFRGRIGLPGEQIFYYHGEPARVGSVTYLPDLSVAGEFAWCPKGQAESLTADQVADRCLQEFLRFIEREAHRK